MNDTISDMLTRIRNGNLVNHKVVKVDYTRLNYMLTRLLKAEGFLRGYETVKKEEQKYIFSVQGRCTLNTPNKDMMNFIMSFRIFLNIGKHSPIRNDEVKLENIISVDYIKLRVY